MATANRRYMEGLNRNAMRRALIAERVHMRQCQLALDSATDKRLRRHCGSMLTGSLNRAAALALALIDMGEAVLTTNFCSDADARLLEVLDSDVRVGNAAASVAHARTRSVYAAIKRGRGRASDRCGRA